MAPKKSLLNPNNPAFKPQNQISEAVKNKAVSELRDWFVGFELTSYHAHLLADEIINKAITARIKATHPTAASCPMSDQDKVRSLVSAGKVIADKLDGEDKLEVMLAELEERDATNEGNSL